MQRQSLKTWLFLAPAGAWFLCMLVLPLIVVFVFSFGERGAAGGYAPAFTLDNFANLGARGFALRSAAVQIENGHPCTLRCERLHARQPDAAGPAGDDGNLVLQTHVLSPLGPVQPR